MSVQFILASEPALFIFGTREAHIIPEILSIVVIQCYITSPIDPFAGTDNRSTSQQLSTADPSDLSGATVRNFHR
jgi:hypothetical protein